MGLLESFSALPVTAALLNEGHNAPTLYPTAFALQTIRGALLGLLGVLEAFVVPWFLDDPRLPPLLLVIAAQPVLAGFHNPRFSELDRALDYRAETARQVVGRIAAFVVTLSIAYVHPTHWALIAGLLTSAAFSSASSYYFIPWRPRWSLDGWRRIVGFSGWLMGANMIRSVTERVDNLIVARVLDLSSTAIYNVGKELPSMAVGELVGPLDRVMFPSLVRYRGDFDSIRLNALRILRALSTVSLILGGLVALISNDLVELLYGSAWRPATMVMPLVALALSIEMATNVAATVALVEGRGAMLLRVSATRAAIRLPVFVLGASWYGLRGAAAGYALGALITALANVGILRRLLRLRVVEVAAAFARPIALALSNAGLVLLAQAAAPEGDGIAELAIRLAASAAVSGLFVIAVGSILANSSIGKGSAEAELYGFVAAHLRRQASRGSDPTR